MTTLLKRIAVAPWFNRLSIALIVVSSLILGALTYPEVAASAGRALLLIESLIIWFFVLELIVRIGAYGRRWWDYFKDGWNLFDFAIVVISILPLHSEAASVFRLLRVLRALRLLKAIPKLQLMVRAMIKSLSSLGYVAVILGIHFYIYALIGIKLFGAIAPNEFGTIGKTLVTMFQIVTLEGWVDIMNGLVAGGVSEFVAAAYFISFILLGTMIIMNLVIGVIINGMMESQQELTQAIDADSAAEREILGEINQLEKGIESLRDEVGRLRELVKSR